MKPGIYQTPGNPVQWKMRYTDRGRSRITADDVRRDIAALTWLVHPHITLDRKASNALPRPRPSDIG